MVALGLTYLHEIGRTSAPSDVVLAELRRSIGLTISEAPFSSVVETATAPIWTRDPFDRLISAQAVVEGETLLTRIDGSASTSSSPGGMPTERSDGGQS